MGALGEVALPAGWVVYVGSAFGSGGLSGRLRHHLRPVSRPRWHLDYLRSALDLQGAWIGAGPRDTEHRWAETFAGQPTVSLPRRRLGSSDCRCPSHLFHLRRVPGRRVVASQLRESSRASEIRFLPIARLASLVRVSS